MAYRTVLVTGANGFIARQLIVTLLNKGYRVRGTLRRPECADTLKTVLSQHAPVEALEFATADLLRDAGWAEAMTGMDAVFHLASPFPPREMRDRSKLLRPAVDGSLRVLKAAHAAGIHRVIVTSSVCAIAYGHGSETRISPYGEHDWTNLEAGGIGAYHESKTRAELAVWDFAMTHPDMEITSINPGAVFGPVIGEDVGTSAGIIRGMLAGEFPGLPRVGFEGVDVRDVADLHERALQNDLSIGNRYICTAGFIWLREIADLLQNEFSDHATKVPARPLPDIAVRLAGLFDAKAAMAVPELGLYTPCSIAKAWNELGWQPRPAMEAVRATAESLIASGQVA